MAIDSTLFVADLPAGTYNVGDRIPLAVHTGPAVVRQGYGDAILKSVISGTLVSGAGATILGDVVVQNSNWIDSLRNGPSSLNEVTALSQQSTGVQSGNNCPIEPNSSWAIYFEVQVAVTTTADNGAYCLIDIEYNAVSAVVDPAKESGFPISIQDKYTVNVNSINSTYAGVWTTVNVDNFKPGYRYLLQKLSVCKQAPGTFTGFVAMANAAGMNGLSRIVPVCSGSANICRNIDYASVLTKGPMDIRFMLFGAVGATDVSLICDYVKRS